MIQFSHGRILIVISIACFAAALLTTGTTGAVAAQDVEGNTASEIKISDWNDLDAIRNKSTNATYILTQDLDPSTAGYESVSSSTANNGNGFKPIGFEPVFNNQFRGTFDGNGHAISGITVDRNNSSTGGLFTEIGPNGTVRNVTLRDISVSGEVEAGGVTPNNFGTIRNVTVNGSIAVIPDSDSNVPIAVAGGLVAELGAAPPYEDWQSQGKIVDSSADVTVYGRRAGGIVGYVREESTVTNTSVNGIVATTARTSSNGIGGVVGNLEGKLNKSSAAVSVEGDQTVGGLVGVNDGLIIHSTASGQIKGTNTNIGGLVGNNRDTIHASSASGTVAGNATDTGGFVGSNSGIIKNSTASGTVTGNGTNYGGFAGVNFDLIANSSATGSVTSQDNRVGGLVGQNLGNITYSYATGDVTGTNNDIGGLVGLNLDYSGQTTINNSFASGAVSGADSDAGGLVGDNDGTISTSYTTGTVTGSEEIGGLVGDNREGVINTAYATGSVSGEADTGGLIGNGTGGTITQSYWDRTRTGQDASDGLASANGLTTQEMIGSNASANLDEFDFKTTWKVVTTNNAVASSDGYPILKGVTEEVQILTPTDEQNDTSDQSDSAQVQLTNVHLTPQSVDLDSQSTHQLTFRVQNVSADGSEDEFDITFPDKVDLVSFSDVAIDEKSSDVNRVDNTLEFSVDPTGGGSTQISGELNVTVSATN